MSENKCFNCSNTSKNAALIKCEVNEEEKWVCVRCLPMLIHG
jgi:hypothetical protein